MTGIFMFILFVVNILTIFAVIVLFMRQNRFMQVEKDQKVLISEMEALMTSYLVEMKEDNDIFLEKLANQQQRQSIPTQSTIVKNDQIDVEQVKGEPLLQATKSKAMAAYKNPIAIEGEMNEVDWPIEQHDSLELSIENKEETFQTAEIEPRKSASFSETLQASLNGQSVVEPSLNEQVNTLFEQGLSIEDIAKQLKRGKTEIELLVKFQLGK